MTDADYVDDPALFKNTPGQAEVNLQSFKQSSGDIGFDVNANKTDYVF